MSTGPHIHFETPHGSGITQEEAQQIAEHIERKGHIFDQLVAYRLTQGAKEYGPLGFMENDVLRMMVEELADLANYARMQGIKLMMTAEALNAELDKQTGSNGDINIGYQAFKATKDGWKKADE